MTHDTIIIGGGPGGYELAAMLAAKGEKVALVEESLLGGTCLNRGCIPTKTLCHAAEVVDLAAGSADFGIAATKLSVDWTALMAKKEEVTLQLRDMISASLAKVEVFNTRASLGENKTVLLADGATLSAERIVIATGSVPASLPIPGCEYTVNSDKLLSLDSLPESIVIVGGGVIGVEFAGIFNSLGVNVTVVEYCKEILPPFDKDVAKRLRQALASRGVTFLVGSQVQSISADGTVTFTDKKGEQSVKAEMVAMAVGRRPNLPDGLEKAGVMVERQGIAVNHTTFETTAPGIYAIGDVNGLTMLAHAASAQARCIAGEKIDTKIIPAAVFTHPEVAMVGYTEEQVKLQGVPYKAVKVTYRGNGKALTMGSTDGLLKLIVNTDSRKILGCHICGAHAADMVQTVGIAMTSGLTVDALSSAVYIHPTLSELLLSAVSQF